MIRLCTAYFKALLKIIPTDEEIFLSSSGDFDCLGAGCPGCGAVGKLSPYGEYPRYLVSFEHKKIVTRLLSILRFECSSCGATHALLPDNITPYSPYSLRFKLTVLIAFYERDTSVAAVCECFEIAVSTVYEWKKLLAVHKDLMLGAINSLKTPALAFLKGLMESPALPEKLDRFFRKHAFSFLENQSASATQSRPP